jgi:hypothetical protein
MVGSIVIGCNVYCSLDWQVLSDVCPIVFGLKQKDTSSIFVFNSTSVYGIREAQAKLEGSEFN